MYFTFFCFRADVINDFIRSQTDAQTGDSSADVITPRAGAQASRLLQQLDDVKREMDCLEQEVQGKDREIELLNK